MTAVRVVIALTLVAILALSGFFGYGMYRDAQCATYIRLSTAAYAADDMATRNVARNKVNQWCR
jgi:hypothetical protein